MNYYWLFWAVAAIPISCSLPHGSNMRNCNQALEYLGHKQHLDWWLRTPLWHPSIWAREQNLNQAVKNLKLTTTIFGPWYKILTRQQRRQICLINIHSWGQRKWVNASLFGMGNVVVISHLCHIMWRLLSWVRLHGDDQAQKASGTQNHYDHQAARMFGTQNIPVPVAKPTILVDWHASCSEPGRVDTDLEITPAR